MSVCETKSRHCQGVVNTKPTMAVLSPEQLSVLSRLLKCSQSSIQCTRSGTAVRVYTRVIFCDGHLMAFKVWGRMRQILSMLFLSLSLSLSDTSHHSGIPAFLLSTRLSQAAVYTRSCLLHLSCPQCFSISLSLLARRKERRTHLCIELGGVCAPSRQPLPHKRCSAQRHRPSAQRAPLRTTGERKQKVREKRGWATNNVRAGRKGRSGVQKRREKEGRSSVDGALWREHAVTTAAYTVV